MQSDNAPKKRKVTISIPKVWIRMDEFRRFKSAMQAEGKSEVTIYKYLFHLVQFETWYKETMDEPLSCSGLSILDLLTYKKYLNEERHNTPTTANAKLSALKAFCKWAYTHGIMQENPAGKIKGFKTQQRTAPKHLKRSEWLKLLRKVHSGRNKRDIAIMELLAHTGIRVGELTRLEITDVQLSDRKGMLNIRFGKGNKPRTVPLNADARSAVSAYLEDRKERDQSNTKYLFVSQKGGKMDESAVWRVVKKYARISEIELSPHILRHTLARYLVHDAGTDLMTVMGILGHSSPNTTSIYTLPSEEEKLEAS